MKPSPRRLPEQIGPYTYTEDFEPPEQDELLADLDPGTVRYIRDTLNGDHDHD
jgi:hypothetical protein